MGCKDQQDGQEWCYWNPRQDSALLDYRAVITRHCHLVEKVIDQEVLAPVACALSFLGTIIMTKVCIAYLISKSSQGITPQTYRNLLSVCGLVMLCFSLYYVWQAYSLIAG